MEMDSNILKIKRKYDIIIFGVTSFTAKWLIHDVLKVQREKDTPRFSWAVAGRSVEKMRDILNKIEAETGDKSLRTVDMIKADVSNPLSIEAMVKQCQLILNLVGPYMEFGEVVVKACAESGTHHLDLCAEPLFLGRMEVKYAKIAEKTNCFIIGACGVASIASDCGSEYLQRNFDGQVNSIESLLKLNADDTKMHKIRYATWHSMILVLHNLTAIFALRRKLYSGGYPPSPNFRLPFWPIQYREEVGSWCLFNPVPDGDVMERSQRNKFQNSSGEKPPLFIQTRPYMQFPKLYMAVLFLVGLVIIGLWAQFKWGLELLKKHPRLFSLGFCTHESSSEVEEEMKNMKFSYKVIAKGWSEQDKEFVEIEPPNKVKILNVNGYNPMYGASATVFLQAGLTVLSEKSKMPKKGGVWSPGVAFAGTGYIDRLNQNGIMFKIEE